MNKLRLRFAVTVAGLVACVVGITPAAVAGTRAAAAVPPGAVGPFLVTNQGTGRCLDIEDRGRLYDCNQWEPKQRWYLVPDGQGRYELANESDGWCLAGWWNGPNGWSVWTSNCDSSFTATDQLWYIPDSGPISNLNGRVLEPNSGDPNSNGTSVEIWDYQGTANQQWKLNYIQ
jgi:hypothetical protein